MDMGIAGKTAVVTGASSGLGKAIAKALAAEGVNLVLFARREERLVALAEDLTGRHGVIAKPLGGDMRRREDVRKIGSLADTLGGPDILVLNTGRPPTPMRAVLDETDDARWEDAYQTQLRAAVSMVHEIVPRMVAKKWGRVIGVTTASVKQPMHHHGLSTVFRAGVTGMLKHLANEVGRDGITVNCICPGSIASDRTGGRSYDIAERISQIPMGRLGRSEEFAAAAVFFASVQAGFITGTSLQVDGGQVASLI